MANLTTIAIDKKNKETLAKLGKAGQSFNDVLTELLSKQVPQQAGGNC